jgi:hypothetical protein
MKGMADEIRSLGEELSDHHLIHQLLRGLCKKYDHMKALIKRTKQLLSFHAVRNDLKLKGLTWRLKRSGVCHSSLRDVFHPPIAAATHCPDCFFCAVAILHAHRRPSSSCCLTCQHQQRAKGRGRARVVVVV